MAKPSSKKSRISPISYQRGIPRPINKHWYYVSYISFEGIKQDDLDKQSFKSILVVVRAHTSESDDVYLDVPSARVESFFTDLMLE